MIYYGYLLLVLVSLAASVFVQGQDLFYSDFFTISYVMMSIVLVAGSKFHESSRIDRILGSLLIFTVGFLSTDALIRVVSSHATEMIFFQIAIIVALDYCALGFLRLGRDMKNIERLKKDDRYGIYAPEETS